MCNAPVSSDAGINLCCQLYNSTYNYACYKILGNFLLTGYVFTIILEYT